MRSGAVGRWRHGRRLGGLAVLTAALLAAAIVVSPAAFASTLFSDDFEDGSSSAWTTSGGTWSVVPDGSLVFRQSATDADASARAGSKSWADYTSTAQVTPIAFAAPDSFVALLARVRSSSSYYYLALQADGTVVLGLSVQGALTTLASAPFAVSPGTTYALTLTVAGSTLSGSVGGGPALTATDGRFAKGQVGFATRFAAGEIDDVVVATPGPMPSPTPVAAR